MVNTLNYHIMVSKLRHFFNEQKGFIEVPAQSRLSILAACEQPETITQFSLNKTSYPLPQTGQMWLEHELLKNPSWKGVYCITTSYRDEPIIIEGRHSRIFPMFEFESHGTLEDLRKIEEELLQYLGFEGPIGISYTQACQRYETEHIEAEHEMALAQSLGPVVSLERFPVHTQPFWNMKYTGDGLYNKIDVLLHGMETIGSAERETDTRHMSEQFFCLADGRYAELLISKFGKERVLKELDEYLALPMITRYGGGIGLTRLERAMTLSGLLESKQPVHHQYVKVTPAHTAL